MIIKELEAGKKSVSPKDFNLREYNKRLKLKAKEKAVKDKLIIKELKDAKASEAVRVKAKTELARKFVPEYEFKNGAWRITNKKLLSKIAREKAKLKATQDKLILKELEAGKKRVASKPETKFGVDEKPVDVQEISSLSNKGVKESVKVSEFKKKFVVEKIVEKPVKSSGGQVQVVKQKLLVKEIPIKTSSIDGFVGKIKTINFGKSNFSGLTTGVNLGSLSKFKSLDKQKPKLVIVSDTEVVVKGMTGVSSIQKLSDLTKSKVNSKVSSVSVVSPVSGVASDIKLRQDVAVDVVSIQDLISKTTFKKEPIKEKKIKKPLYIPFPKALTTKSSGKNGYDVFVKSKGKFVKVAENSFSKTDALRTGQYLTDNSTNASFKIKPSSKRVDTKLELPNLSSKFGKSKAKGLNTKSVYVERRKNRIDTIGEVKGLRVGKLAKSIGLKTPKKTRQSSNLKKISVLPSKINIKKF